MNSYFDFSKFEYNDDEEIDEVIVKNFTSKFTIPKKRKKEIDNKENKNKQRKEQKKKIRKK